jgi:hypothetical protein
MIVIRHDIPVATKKNQAMFMPKLFEGAVFVSKRKDSSGDDGSGQDREVQR